MNPNLNDSERLSYSQHFNHLRSIGQHRATMTAERRAYWDDCSQADQPGSSLGWHILSVLKYGMSVPEVAELTGLSEDTINTLRARAARR